MAKNYKKTRYSNFRRMVYWAFSKKRFISSLNKLEKEKDKKKFGEIE